MKFLILILFSLSEISTESAYAGVNVDAVCGRALARNKSQGSSPSAQPTGGVAVTEISTACTSMEGAEYTAKVSKTMAVVHIPIAAVCATATGFCLAAPTVKLGNTLSKICGYGTMAGGIADDIGGQILQAKLDSQSGNLSAGQKDPAKLAQQYGTQAIGIVNQFKDGVKGTFQKASDEQVKAGFADKDGNLTVDKDGNPSKGGSPSAGKAVNCLDVGLTTVTEGVNVASKFSEASAAEGNYNNTRKQISDMASQSGGMSGGNFKGDGQDGAHNEGAPVDGSSGGSIAADPGLFNDPKIEEFKKAYDALGGMPFDSIMNSTLPPDQLMNQVMSSLPGVTPSVMDAGNKFLALAGKPPSDGEGAFVAPPTSYAANETMNFDDLLKNLTPKEAAKVEEQIAQGRDLASIKHLEYDRMHSIFERVTQRYQLKVSTLERLPWMGKYNLSLNPQPMKPFTNDRLPASAQLRP